MCAFPCVGWKFGVFSFLYINEYATSHADDKTYDGTCEERKLEEEGLSPPPPPPFPPQTNVFFNFLLLHFLLLPPLSPSLFRSIHSDDLIATAVLRSVTGGVGGSLQPFIRRWFSTDQIDKNYTPSR